MTATVTRIGAPTVTDAFTAAELVTAAGCTWRQYDFWYRTGRIKSCNGVRGHGYSRLFTADEVSVATTAKRLIDAGFTTTAKRLIDAGFTTTAALDLARKFIEQDTRSLDVGGIIITRWAE